MGLIAFLKYAVNKTIGTKYFYPLDELLGATIILRGTSGTTFHIKNVDGFYEDFTIKLTEDSDVYKGLERIHLVPVCLGTYEVTVSSEGFSTTVTKTISASQLGKKYLVTYVFNIAELTASGNVQIPDNLDRIIVTACGGGGGGGGGSNATKSGGGGGGGGADFIQSVEYSVTPGSTLNVKVGNAGQAGNVGSNGGVGGSTIIGSLVTLAGGKAGGGASSTSAGAAGAGSGAGASGGKGGANGADGSAGGDSSAAKGGAGGSGYVSSSGNVTSGGGGGGGGSLSSGGNGGDYSSSTEAEAGTKGGGGGGGEGAAGAKGGGGYVLIGKGVVA